MGLFMRDFISLDELFTGRPLVGLPEDKSFEKRIEARSGWGTGFVLTPAILVLQRTSIQVHPFKSILAGLNIAWEKDLH